ncbi:MAG TPA: GyrI-like domain-containing protein [Streptosporangiaceae bacterium]|nr:GyrI-like domain-containing protein [Streptosporangiaceae bacterium]
MSYSITSDALPQRLTLIERAHLDITDVAGWLQRVYQEVFSYIASRDVVVTGPPFGRYTFHDGTVDVEAGVPVAAPVAAGGHLVMSVLPPTKAAVTCHIGPYERLIDAYEALEKWIHDHGFERNGPHWEVYLTDPLCQPDAERWRTVVIMPYRTPIWASGDLPVQ